MYIVSLLLYRDSSILTNTQPSVTQYQSTPQTFGHVSHQQVSSARPSVERTILLLVQLMTNSCLCLFVLSDWLIFTQRDTGGRSRSHMVSDRLALLLLGSVELRNHS